MKRARPDERRTGWFQALTPTQRAALPYIALISAIFAVYANVYHNAFVWDDWHLIYYNDGLRSWRNLPDLLRKTTLGPYYRPVQVLVYFFIYQICGLSREAFHGVNILLHAANACLMFRLGCRLGFHRRAAFAAALLWGVHPLWIEAVAVMSGTGDLLVCFFCMTGLLILLPDFTQQKTSSFTPRRLWFAILFVMLALGSKESAVVFPALATFTLFLVSARRMQPATYIRTWPLWLLTTSYMTGLLLCPALNNMGSYMVRGDDYIALYENNFINRVLTSLASLPVYLGLILTPAKLHIAWNTFPIFETFWDWQVIAGAAIVALSLLQIFRGRGLPLTWGLLWFAAAFSPYAGILKPIDGQIFEHWIYLPAIGLFLGVSQTVAVWMDGLRSKNYSKEVKIIAAGLLISAALVLGAKTYLQNTILRDGGSLYEYIVAENPSVWAHYNLGVYYFGMKAYDKAEEQWHDVEADDYKPFLNEGGEIFMHNALAYIYLNALSDKSSVSLPDIMHALPSSTRIPEAIEELKASLEVNPHRCCASEFLAVIYAYLGDKQKLDYYNALTEKNKPASEVQESAAPMQ